MLVGGLISGFCCISPLAHGPHVLEVNAVIFFMGMAIGGVAWKIYQRGTPRSDDPKPPG